jgi:hypothetical protein
MTTEAERKFCDDLMRAHVAQVLLGSLPRGKPKEDSGEFEMTVMTLLCIRKMCQAKMDLAKLDAQRTKRLLLTELFLRGLGVDTSEERFVAAIRESVIEHGLQEQSPWRSQS